jgi:hypothetical protein
MAPVVIKYFRKLIAFLFIFAISIYSQEEFQLQQGTVVVPVDGNTAKDLLKTEDEYTNVLSKFDLMSKTLKEDENAAKLNYLVEASLSVEEWTQDEKKVLGKVVSSVKKKIDALGLKLNMPSKIEVIKSTMDNEGGAEGYTRGNYIVLKSGRVREHSESFEELFTHELFHVLSRFDREMCEKVYNTIGFTKCNEVPYPPEIADKRISNPDAPFNNFYITVQHGGKNVDAMLILYSPKDYSGGSFFAYMQLGLMVVEGEPMDKKPVYENGKPVILKIKEVTGFHEKTGKNTSYNIHAEEISADHFKMLVGGADGLPNPELIEAMKNIMK